MLRISLLIILVAAACGPLSAASLRVAVASNFLMPARALAQRFEAMNGQEISISAGSTGKLYAQIVNGAPFAVFLAANAAEPKRLEASGHAVPGSRFTYATGRLVLWSRDPALFAKRDGADLIRQGSFARLAVANPRTAPYGSAAVQAMRTLGVQPESLGSRLLRGENVSQAFQFVASGNADAGFVALSQVRNPERPLHGSRWLVPAELHDSIEQQTVLLIRGSDDRDARAFLDFLRLPEALEVIAAYGYGPG